MSENNTEFQSHIANIKAYWELMKRYNARLERDLKDCRNELCLKCGEYKQKHLGACDGCRWEEVN